MENVFPFIILGLGLVTGLKHAFDADHIVAVSTMVSESKSFFRSSMIGASWGIGHTFTLLVIGIIVLAAGITIPPKLALSFEALVGVILIILGISIFWRFMKQRVHLHVHSHDQGNRHIHQHHHSEKKEGHHHSTPFRKKSIFVGMFHGMAGSAALILIILSTIESFFLGVFFILIFGAGSIMGMFLVTGFIGLPFKFTAKRFAKANIGIKLVSGSLSIVIGCVIIIESFILGIILGIV
jgi:ABC-type nickel/cobalt efflux system permease component RcnA